MVLGLRGDLGRNQHEEQLLVTSSEYPMMLSFLMDYNIGYAHLVRNVGRVYSLLNLTSFFAVAGCSLTCNESTPLARGSNQGQMGPVLHL